MKKKTFFEKFSDHASAVAFAECGEWDYAREFLGDYDTAAKSTRRKFVIIFDDKKLEPSFLEYITNLAKRLCYDIVFLQASKKSRTMRKAKDSLPKIKDLFFAHYHGFLTGLSTADIDVHFFVAIGNTNKSFKKLYNSVGKVEFAIAREGIGFDTVGSHGLPLFLFRP